MNQTRTFLFLALVFVAYLLFNQWMQDYHRPPPAPAPTAAAPAASATSAGIPGATPATVATGNTATNGKVATAAPIPAEANAAAHGQLITVTTDVLALTIDSRGGTLVSARLLDYPETLGSSQDVRLLSDAADDFYEAQSGLIGVGGDAAPNHKTLFHADSTSYALAPGQKQLAVTLHWSSPTGVTVAKTYTFTRGSYAIKLAQTITNGSNEAWQGQAYHQLERVTLPEKKYGNWLEKYSDQSRYSFFGAAWYGPGEKFNQVKFDDFKDHPLAENGKPGREVTGGWIAMEQVYFVGAWLLPQKTTSTFSTVVLDAHDASAKSHYLIRTIGPRMHVAPGQSTTSSARVFLGPKTPEVLASVEPSFHLALNYGWGTIIARPLHWILAKLHGLVGNWGWAIVLLVLLINAVIYKLNALQYRSSAHMRRLKPKMDALKERFGDDKQKLQQAMMEMYKKEHVNPMAGCLPALVTLPIFFGLYELLRESVELRQAPFILWIHDLSAADPYFILPVLYGIVMLAQGLMMPMSPGMSSTQQKLMRYMPAAYAVMFAFWPAALSVYYIFNTLCRLLTMWWVYREVDHEQARKSAVKS